MSLLKQMDSKVEEVVLRTYIGHRHARYGTRRSRCDAYDRVFGYRRRGSKLPDFWVKI